MIESYNEEFVILKHISLLQIEDLKRLKVKITLIKIKSHVFHIAYESNSFYLMFNNLVGRRGDGRLDSHVISSSTCGILCRRLILSKAPLSDRN